MSDELTANTTIAELLETHPAAVRVLVTYRMHCVGCDIARFETIGNACAIYGVAVPQFLAAIRPQPHEKEDDHDLDAISDIREHGESSIGGHGHVRPAAPADPGGIRRDARTDADAAPSRSVVGPDHVTSGGYVVDAY